MNFDTKGLLALVLVALFLLPLANAAQGDEGTTRTAIARWFFNGDGTDEMGSRPITLFGGATFASACGSEGLFTSDAGSYGTYPPIGQMPTGTISFQFSLDAAFQAGGGYSDPIIIISSNRVGHLVGDVGVTLAPEDGRLTFIQERPLVSPDWLLKSTKSYWEPDVCYRVEIEWNSIGRSMKITTPGYFEMNSDAVTRDFAFSLDATLTTVLSRAGNSPPIGVRLDWLEVAGALPPVGTEATSWGRMKSLFR